ncbi:hypothetical protein MBLNU13_g02345t2 [Cladosporium sp. NU13]
MSLRKYLQPQLGPKDDLEVKVYDEARVKPAGEIDYSWHDHSDIRSQKKNQGAAISLQANAFKVLRALDPQLAERVYAAGLPCRGFTWKNASDWVLGYEDLEAHLISRPVLIECLMGALPEGIVQYRTVANVTIEEGSKPTICFSDGGEEIADLVVGADGIRSPLRKALFGEGEEYRPKYLGNCAVGGVLDLDEPLPQAYLDEPRVVFIHGSAGTFGYGGLSQSSPKKLIYFSFYDTELPERGQKPEMEAVTRELRRRHSGWGDPMIARCLKKADIDNIYPIFYMPDLPRWGRDRCVLVGDAAHAMTPATGQGGFFVHLPGGSQALEDGQTLALLLAHLIQNHAQDKAIEMSIQGLFDIRAEHTAELKAKGLAIKEPQRPWSWTTTALVYAFYFGMTKAKWLSGLFGQPVYPAHLFDAKEEVARYVAAKLKAT